MPSASRMDGKNDRRLLYLTRIMYMLDRRDSMKYGMHTRANYAIFMIAIVFVLRQAICGLT